MKYGQAMAGRWTCHRVCLCVQGIACTSLGLQRERERVICVGAGMCADVWNAVQDVSN